MARLTGPNWVDELPWVLLGIRTAPKDELQSSTAELVYGAPLCVPGDFICGKSSARPNELFLPWLRNRVEKFTPTPMSRHKVEQSHVPTELFKCTYVFVR